MNIEFIDLTEVQKDVVHCYAHRTGNETVSYTHLDVYKRQVSDQETMSYTYYQKNVKPKPETEGKKGFVCKVCGYIYEGDELPEDYICPLCKHGAVDFEPIG